MTTATIERTTVEWLGITYDTVLRGADSGGAMAIIDCTAPVDAGPPRHVHAAEDECFVVLTGRCEFWLEGETFTRGPGETAFIGRGRQHTFRVIGTEPSRHLVILTPAGFEGFFEEMARESFRIPEDMQEVEASAARHNLSFTGPPLGAG